MTQHCTCHIENRGPRNPRNHAGTTVMDLHIVFCPLHAVAPELVEAAKAVVRLTHTYSNSAESEAVAKLRQALTLAQETP